ncbi:MAG: gliding motility-related protein [Bacteroidetes bacterium]|nr:gliding motility-related protein [Bacteroidota bacterium]
MKKIITALSLLCFLFIGQAKASHIAGGDLSYVCLGGNQYQINLNLFVDCLGFDPGASQTINFTSTCGGTATATVNATNPGGTEISQLCPSQINNSTCNGGTLPGMWVFSFTGTVTLAPPCDTWTMSWTTCCRNAAILNLVTPSSFGSYIEATLHSGTAPCNNSPAFTAQPIPYVCQGQLVNYSYGVVETDGDSLYYSFIGAMDAGGTPLAYSPGYSATSPIPGITINPTTGMLTFTPTTLGNFVVVVLVQEYDSNGNLIGTVMRDIQFIVQTCSNVVPDPAAGTITGMTGSAVQTGPFSIELCEGSNFTFTATYNDANAGDSLTLFTNLSTVLPGATISVSGGNPAVATISWTAPAGSANTNTTFSITVNDGACPVPGQQTFVYDIQVQPRTLGGGDKTICGPQTATLNGTGGNTFNWAVLSGPPMVVGTNFSCNPCANPVASPSATTVYEVTSDLSGTCVNKDTVTVTVVPDYSFNVTQSTTSSCLTQPILLNTTATPAGSYTYSWSPGTYLSSTSIPNPVATITTPGAYSYVLTLTSPLGCVKKDTVDITIAANYPPNPILTASDTTVCLGDTVTLTTMFGSSVPASCGFNPVGCSAALMGTVGSGSSSNTTTSYPAPYGNWYTTVKQQFLYTAAELNAAGITGGKIDQLDFNVTAISGITTYHFYTISMGCTNLTTFPLTPTAFETGLFNVFPSSTYNISTGWNAHPFTGAFEWDGISNVIVEVCFNELNPGANYTTNSTTTSTPTAYASTLYSLSDGSDQCSGPPSFLQTANEHPQIRFHYCGAAPDSSRYTYAWFPGGSVFNPSSQVTGAVPPSGTTQYMVVVTDTVSGCLDTAFVNVDASVTTLVVNAGPDTTICPGTPTQLNATGASQYTWTPATGLSSTTISNPVASPTVPTTYTVTGTSQCATGSSSDVITVNAVNSVILNVNAGNDVIICPGVPTQLTATGASNYSWSPAATLSNAFIANPFASPMTMTTYTVTGSGPCANPVTDSVTVGILPFSGPLASDAGSNQVICVGEPVALSGATSGGYGNNMYSWSVVSGTFVDSIPNSTQISTSLVPTVSGVTVYQLMVTDQCGYVTSDTVIIDVLLDCQLIIPNIFTPNGDGVNDEFLVSGNGIKSFSMTIYNRWGIKVFQSDDIATGWNGGNSPDGTYYAIIKAETISGKTFDQGHYFQLLGNR